MAHIEYINIFESNQNTRTLAAYIALKPAGKVRVDFTLPDKFYDCIVDAAQAAADLHEQQMKAEILAEKSDKHLEPAPLSQQPQRDESVFDLSNVRDITNAKGRDDIK